MAKKKAAPEPPAPEPTRTPKRIRILKELGTPRRAFFIGTIAAVGEDVSEETALAWIAQGVAEEEV